MRKILFVLLVAAMTMVGCKKADTNNELKPFDGFTLMEFDDPQIARYLGTHSTRDGYPQFVINPRDITKLAKQL